MEEAMDLSQDRLRYDGRQNCCQLHEGLWESGGIVSRILNLVTR